MDRPSQNLKAIYEKTRAGSPLESVGTVLNKVVSSMGLERRLRENALMGLWPQVAGDALSRNTRPLFVDGERNLVVACATGAVAQEISLMKPQLTRQLSKMASSLKLDIKGIRLDLKHYHRSQPESREMPPVPPGQPAADVLSGMELSESDLFALQDLRRQLDNGAASDNTDLQLRILKLYEQQLRIRAWRRQQGYPNCHHCGEPTPRLHPTGNPADNRLLCPPCLYSGYTTDTY